MNSIKIYSRRLKEATASSNLFTPSALGPLVLGQTILCNPTAFLPSKALSILHASRLLSEMRYYVNQNKKPVHSMPSCIHPFLTHLNLNIIVEVSLVKLNHYLSLSNIPATLPMETEEVAL